uniref:Uncharacterized protein n=1 Tax=Panagrolaimus superbus TaxID=310955 RepID=A0A914Z2L1_9BILA
MTGRPFMTSLPSPTSPFISSTTTTSLFVASTTFSMFDDQERVPNKYIHRYHPMNATSCPSRSSTSTLSLEDQKELDRLTAIVDKYIPTTPLHTPLTSLQWKILSSASTSTPTTSTPTTSTPITAAATTSTQTAAAPITSTSITDALNAANPTTAMYKENVPLAALQTKRGSWTSKFQATAKRQKQKIQKKNY